MKRQTHNERVLELLSDGQPHTHHEGYGLHVVWHSRIADLRKKGHVIRRWRDGDDYVYLLVRGRGDGQASAPSNEQLAPPSLIPAGCSTFSAPERRWEPAPDASNGGGASGVAHASDGAGAENTSGDTSAGRAVTYAAGNELHPSASPEQLSLEAA